MSVELIYLTEKEGGEWETFPLDSFRTLCFVDRSYPSRFAALALRKGKTLYVYDLILRRLGGDPLRKCPAPK